MILGRRVGLREQKDQEKEMGKNGLSETNAFEWWF